MASRRGLAIDGVLLLDKPVGLSSNHALQRARGILNAKKAGHTGTLDPFASGLMVLCFGAATKYSAGMFEADKTYVATMQFGAETDTGDCTGTVTAEQKLPVYPWLANPERLRSILAQFTGRISQVPPMHSALKRDGKPLYVYARQGIELEREARDVHIYRAELLECDAANGTATIEVECSKGTYIRTLAQDIGRAAENGAHLISLRRTRTAGFDIAQAITLEQLEAQEQPLSGLLPIDTLLQSMPCHCLPHDLARRFALGQTVTCDEPGNNAKVRVYAAINNQFLGTARREGGWLRPDRLMAPNEEVSS